MTLRERMNGNKDVECNYAWMESSFGKARLIRSYEDGEAVLISRSKRECRKSSYKDNLQSVFRELALGKGYGVSFEEWNTLMYITGFAKWLKENSRKETVI
jgi:hypothetical protein